MPVMTTGTVAYSCRPYAALRVGEDAADVLDAVLTALEQDDRVLAPACGYDYELGQIGATFQVELEEGADDLAAATAIARAAFDAALAGTSAHTIGVAVVEGDDPDLLP